MSTMSALLNVSMKRPWSGEHFDSGLSVSAVLRPCRPAAAAGRLSTGRRGAGHGRRWHAGTRRERAGWAERARLARRLAVGRRNRRLRLREREGRDEDERGKQRSHSMDLRPAVHGPLMLYSLRITRPPRSSSIVTCPDSFSFWYSSSAFSGELSS